MANRQNTFLIKRSNVPGKIPNPGDLQLGELALNTSDVILYASGTTANQILPIGWDRISRTGDTVTGDFNFFGDIQISGSSQPGGYALSVTGDTNLVGDVYVLGDLNYSGSVFITGSTIIEDGLTANTIYTDYIDFNNALSPLPPDLEGRIYWDEDNGTLSLGMHGGQVVQQIGLEHYYYIKNQSGATISNGRVVRAAGTLGSSGRILGEYMIADGTIPPKFTLGIATEDIVNGDEGYVTEFGLVRGIDATGSLYGETWTGGTILYVSPTIAGGLTSVEPTAPDLKIEMAIVINADANGSIFVRPNRYPYLYDLQQVNYSAGTENNLDILQWNSSNLTWDKTNTPSFNGLNINGNLTVTGDTISSTISATTYYNLPTKVNVDFTFDATYTTSSGTFGQIPLNVVILSASTYNNTYTGMTGVLVCDISQSDVGINGEFDLYNLTDATSVTGSATSFTSTDDLKRSSSFSIPSSNFDDTFRVRLRRTSGVGSDNVRIRSAQLILTLI